MFKRHRTAIIVYVVLLIIAIFSGLNLYLLIENANTRDERIQRSVEQVAASIRAEEKSITIPTQQPHIPVKGIDYVDGKDGMSIKGDTGLPGKDGQSIKGDTGVPGKDGNNGLTLEIRCNTRKNRWETKYTGDLNWQIMNNEVVKCTIDKEKEDDSN